MSNNITTTNNTNIDNLYILISIVIAILLCFSGKYLLQGKNNSNIKKNASTSYSDLSVLINDVTTNENQIIIELVKTYDDILNDGDGTILKLFSHLIIKEIQIFVPSDVISIYLLDDINRKFIKIASSQYSNSLSTTISLFLENSINTGKIVNIQYENCYLKDEIHQISQQYKFSSTRIEGLLFSPILTPNNKIIGAVELLRKNSIFTTKEASTLSSFLSRLHDLFSKVNNRKIQPITPSSTSKLLTLRTLEDTDEMDFYRNEQLQRRSSVKKKTPVIETDMMLHRVLSSHSISSIFGQENLISRESICEVTLSEDSNDIYLSPNRGHDPTLTITTDSVANEKNSQIELIDNSRFDGGTTLSEILKYIGTTYQSSPKNIRDIETLAKEMDCYDFDPFVYTIPELITIAEITIGRYYLIETFKINPIKLRNFIKAVAYLYLPDNNFHNFYHASQVLNNCYQILRLGADKYLTPTDILLVFVAALCHDIDHPGNNNNFETKKKSWLSIRYSDDAILERHALSITYVLLDDIETSILTGMSPEDIVTFRHQLRAAIISTDMKHHKHLVEEMAIVYDVNDTESRNALCIHILHCADLSAQTQTTKLALKWSTLINEEFKNQAEKEKILNLELTDIMQNLDNDLERSKLQVNFIENVVLPLWSAFATNIPSLSFAVDRVKLNLKHHTTLVESLLQNKN